MLGNDVNEFKKFVENNAIAVFSAMYRVEYIVDQAGGPDNLKQADHKMIAQQLIFKGMPASLPGVIIDTIMPPEETSIESEILGEALANIARANEEKVKGLYEVLDCMLTDDLEKFKTLDSVDMTNNQMMVNCDFFNAYKIFHHYMTQTLGKGGEKRSAEQQQAIESNLDKIYEEAVLKKAEILEKQSPEGIMQAAALRKGLQTPKQAITDTNSLEFWIAINADRSKEGSAEQGVSDEQMNNAGEFLRGVEEAEANRRAETDAKSAQLDTTSQARVVHTNTEQRTDYLKFDPIVESFSSKSMQKAGADDLVSNPLALEPELTDFKGPIEASVTTSETTQQPNRPENTGYNFTKIFLYATAAVGAGYLAYKVAQNTSIVENAKEFGAEAAKELAIYALVDNEVGSKMGGRQ